jgi:hypothetical protein
VKNPLRHCAAFAVLWICCTRLGHSEDSQVLIGVRMVDKQLIVRSLDLANPQAVQERGKLNQQNGERLNGVFQNADRSINVLRTTTARGAPLRALVRDIGIPGVLTDAAERAIGGLSSTEAISSLLLPISGPPVALVAHYSDTPPFFLVTLQTGPQWIVITRKRLEADARYGHLTQCPDGSVYATSMEPEAHPRLVQIDLHKSAVVPVHEIAFNGVSLQNDVADLACGRSGQLYALADPTYSRTNSLFAINSITGAATWISAFDVERMAFVH